MKMTVPLDDILQCGCPASWGGEAEAGPFIVRCGRHMPSCSNGVHHHAEDRLILPLRGSFSSTYAGHMLCASAGDALYRPAGEPHVDRYIHVMDCVTLLLPSEARVGLGRPAFVATDTAFGRAAWALRHEAAANDGASVLVREGLATLLSAALLDGSPVKPESATSRWVGEVRERLSANRYAPPSLSELARQAGRDPAYVAATFKRAYGMSIGTYVRRLRLWDARDAIDNDPSASITDIAVYCGFSDQSHFGRHFKRVFGVAPGAYRRRQGRPPIGAERLA
jgi:AraC family transcriptional regulator